MDGDEPHVSGPKLTNIGADHKGVDFETVIPHASGWEIPVRVTVAVRRDDEGIEARVTRAVCLGFSSAAYSDETFEIRAGVDVLDGIDVQMLALLADLAIEEWCRPEEPEAVSA